MKINRVELGMSLALFTAILGAGAFAPIGEGNSAPGNDDSAGAGSLQSYWNATMREFRDGWRGVFGGMRGTSYQLYANMGSADAETRQRYYAAVGSEEINRVFSGQ